MNNSLGIAKSFTQNQKHFQNTRKEKITDLTQLTPGDHVSFYRSDFSYSHHGIVHDARPNHLELIHYFNTAENAWNSLVKGSLYLAEVIKSEWKVDLNSASEELYLHHYDGIKCYSNKETLERAISDLGRRGYSLFANNCEHWARWCRTGDSYSEQVFKFHHVVKQKAAALFLVDPGALLVKDLAVVGTESLGTFLSAVGSGLVLTTVETISTVIDIRKKRNERRDGSLSEMAFKKYVVRRISSASGTVSTRLFFFKIVGYIFVKVMGGVTGTIVGTILIPVPILGSVIGGVIGTVSGKVIGGLSGIAISKVVEVHHKQKQENVENLETISELMINLMRQNEKLFQGLRTYALDSDQETQVEVIVKKTTTITASSSSPALFSLFQQLISQYSTLTDDECLVGTRLVGNISSNLDDSECFALTPVPDENAPEEFASAMDLLVLRWPNAEPKPWHNGEEHVLHINDYNTEKGFVE